MKKVFLGRLATAILLTFIWSLFSPVMAAAPSPIKIAFSSPSAGMYLQEDEVVVSGTIKTRVEVVSVDLLVNGVLHKTSHVISSHGGDNEVTFIWKTRELSAGKYHLTLIAHGKNGEQASANTYVSLTGQRRASSAPRILFPTEGSRVSGEVTVKIASEGEAGSNVVLLVDGRLRAITNVTPYRIVLDTSSLSPGLHTLQAQVYGPTSNVVSSRITSIQVTGDSNAAEASNVIVELPSLSNATGRMVLTTPPNGEKLRVAAGINALRESGQTVSLAKPQESTAVAQAPPRQWQMKLTSRISDLKPTVTEKPKPATMSEVKQDYCLLPSQVQNVVPLQEPRLGGAAISLVEKGAPEVVAETPEPKTADTSVVATAVPIAAEEREVVRHTVERGDCLWNLAYRYGTTIDAIATANALKDPSKILIGQKLWIPKVPALSIDGKEVDIQPGPFFSNGKLMVPLRAIVEACGGAVAWDQETEKVSFSLNQRNVTLGIGDTQVLVNGNSMKLKGQPVLQEGRTFVPLQTLREIAALPARFEPEENSIEIARLPH